jgi:fucose permease
VAASCAGFVLIGALLALREEHGLTPSGAGLGLSMHFVGGDAGVLATSAMPARISNRLLLGASYALMVAGGLGFALAGSWPLALAAAFAGGLGFGGIDYGLNHLFAVGFGDRGAAMLNILNAFFGIGAVAGPAVLAVLGPERYPAAFAGCAVLAAALIPFLRGVAPHEPNREAAEGTSKTPVSRGRLLTPVLAGFFALYVLNVAVESGVGGWEPTHLEAVGYGTAAAATATSVFWLMMMAGRFLVVPLTLRWSAERILLVSGAGLTGCLLLTLADGAAPYAYAGVGLFIAPIFPTGLVWLHRAVPRARRAGAWVFAVSMLGGVAAPPALGRGIELSDVTAVPVMLTVMSAAGLAVTCWLVRATRATA